MPGVVAPDAVVAGEAFKAEHVELRTTIQRYAADNLAEHADAFEVDGAFPTAVFAELGKLGAWGLAVSEVRGGTPDAWAEVALWEGLAAALSGSVTQTLRSHADAVALVGRGGGSDSQLEAAIAGELVLADAATGADLGDLSITAHATDNGWQLTGSADLVVGGARAQSVLVVADATSGPCLFLVSATVPGLAAEPLELAGLYGTDVAHLTLDDVVVSEADLVGPAGELLPWAQSRSFTHAALLVAEADLLLEETRAYADARLVFGKPISSLQVQQHRLVDVATRIEATRRAAYDVCDRYVTGDGVADAAARLDLAARDMLSYVADECLQLHGGYGYSREYRAQRVWRDAQHLHISDGGDDSRRDRIAAILTTLPTDVPQRVSPAGSRLPLYDDEHLAYQARAMDLFRELRPQVDAWEADEEYPRSVLAQIGSRGLLGALIEPKYGGTGPDPLARLSMIERTYELGSGGVGADVGAHSDLAMVYLAKAGTQEQKDRFLPDAVAGTSIGALAITEPAAGSNVAGITTTATPTDGGWLLRGTKHFITNGAWFDWVIITARSEPDAEKPHRGLSLFIVPADTPGLSRRRMKMLGWRTSHTGEISLDDVHVPAEALLGPRGTGFYQIMVNFAWERLMLAWSAVGLAEATLRQAVAKAQTQTLSGRPLIEHGGVRHRLADLAANVLQGRAITEHALRLYVAAGDPQVQNRSTAMAKLVTQRLAVKASEELMAVAGPDGQRRARGIERDWRDARLGPIGGGTDEIMREIIKKTYGMA